MIFLQPQIVLSIFSHSQNFKIQKHIKYTPKNHVQIFSLSNPLSLASYFHHSHHRTLPLLSHLHPHNSTNFPSSPATSDAEPLSHSLRSPSAKPSPAQLPQTPRTPVPHHLQRRHPAPPLPTLCSSVKPASSSAIPSRLLPSDELHRQQPHAVPCLFHRPATTLPRLLRRRLETLVPDLSSLATATHAAVAALR